MSEESEFVVETENFHILPGGEKYFMLWREGEGMAMPKEDLDALLAKYFEENF